MSSTGAGWAQLRQQTRQLETQTEALFHTYSQYSTLANVPPKPTPEELKTESQLNSLLDQRASTLTTLTRLLDADPTPSALKSSHLARHRETLTQHRSDLARLQSQLNDARNRANLLASVRSDISAYRAGPDGSAEAEYMLAERARIDDSHTMADGVLAQAYAVNENFAEQREMLENVRRRVTLAVGTIPGVNGLMSRIGSKKRRDGIILGSFIAFCCLAVFYFM